MIPPTAGPMLAVALSEEAFLQMRSVDVVPLEVVAWPDVHVLLPLHALSSLGSAWNFPEGMCQA